MKEYDPHQSLLDILTHLEAAHRYIGSSSYEEFQSDEKTVDAVQLRLQNASEAARRLNQAAPDMMRKLKEHHPEVNWNDFRGFSSVSRHDYDLVEAKLMWAEFQPNGHFPLIEAAIRQEISLSVPIARAPVAADNPLHAKIFARSETFTQSMRCRVVDIALDKAMPFEGRIVWLGKLAQSEGSLALVQIEGESIYRRLHAAKADGVKIGDTVTVEPSERGFALTRKGLEQNQQLRPRMS